MSQPPLARVWSEITVRGDEGYRLRVVPGHGVLFIQAQIRVVVIVVGYQTWPGRRSPTCSQMGIIEVIEVAVAVVSVSGFVVGTEGEKHRLGRRQTVGLLSGEELRSIRSK